MTAAPPGSVTAGAGFGLIVAAEDPTGHIDTTFTGPITLALANNPGGAVLGGTLTATAAGGVATFSGLTLNLAAAGYTLTAAGGNLTALTTDPIGVIAAAASHLVVTSPPPATVTAGAGFGLIVAADAPFGNVDTSFHGAVTLSLAANPGGASTGVP